MKDLLKPGDENWNELLAERTELVMRMEQDTTDDERKAMDAEKKEIEAQIEKRAMRWWLRRQMRRSSCPPGHDGWNPD